MLGLSPLASTPLGATGGAFDYFTAPLPLKELWASDGVAYLHDVLPVKTLSADGVVGEVGASSSPLNLPTKTLDAFSGTGILALDLPLKTLLASGLTGSVSDTPTTFPMKTLDASGLTGTVGVLSTSLPALELFAYGDEGAAFDLPTKGLMAAGVVGTDGTLVVDLPAKTLLGEGLGTTIGVAEFALPVKQFAATGVSENIGTLTVNLPIKHLASDGMTGGVGSLEEDLPALSLVGLGYYDITAAAALVLPLLQLEAAGFSTLPQTFRTWALNMRNRALTEYTGWTFDSFAVFRGATLAAGADGVVVLSTQNVDNNTQIASTVRDGALEYGSSRLKRVPRIYVGLESDGDMVFRTITTEHGRRSYLLPENGAGLRSRRVPVGKGPKSRYWQWEAANSGGAAFTLESVALYPVELTRRVQ